MKLAHPPPSPVRPDLPGNRNRRIVYGFLLFTTLLVAAFSVVFHQIMVYEGAIIPMSPAFTGR